MNEDQIAAYLQHKMPDVSDVEVSQLWRIPGGASRETWSFDAAWRDGEEQVSRGFIVRRDPEASLLETERYVEFRVYQAMRDTGVPVPEMYWLEEDTKWLERPFFVMSRLPGQASQMALVSGMLGCDLEAISQRKVEILARIHDVDWRALGLDFLGVPDGPEGCPDMEIERWEKTMREQTMEPQPVLEMALAWLRAHKPVAQKVTVVHGDYRTGNFLVDGNDITGILDWEMVHLGDPLEDVAWVCVRAWRWAGDAKVGGLMMRDDFYRRYEAASGLGVDPEAVRFWEVLGNFKWAVICMTGARSFAEGRSKDAIHVFTAKNKYDIEVELLKLIA